MTVIFPKHKATFVHIPKNAGSSFSTWAKHIKPVRFDGHKTIFQLRETNDAIGWEFAFVRDPLSRLISVFHWKAQQAKKREKKRKLGRKVKNSTDQKLDLEIISYYEFGFTNFVYDLHYGIQTPYTNSGALWFQSIWIDEYVTTFKVEELHKNFVILQDYFDCYKSLPWKNKSKHGTVADQFDSNTIKLAVNMYEPDFDAFNYSKDFIK
jgi:hypothetical protein